MSEDEAYTDWFVVLKRSLGIPDIVSGANVEAVIEGWIREHLETAIWFRRTEIAAAKQFMPAIKELAVAGALDSYVLGGLTRYFRPLGDRTAAELVVREAFPEVTVLTTETAEALLAVAGEITDRMFDYVETHNSAGVAPLSARQSGTATPSSGGTTSSLDPLDAWPCGRLQRWSGAPGCDTPSRCEGFWL